MNALLDNLVVYQGYDKNYREQDKRRGAGTALTVSFQCVINKADHGIESACIVCRAHFFAEYTDYAGIFLKSAYKAGDNNVRQHRRKQGNGYAGKNSSFWCSVNLGGIVILPIYTLQTAQKNKYLKGKSVPHYINYHYRHIGNIGRAGVYPVDRLSAEKLDNIIYDSPGIRHITSLLKTYYIEHCGENHTDSNGICNVGQEEYSLQGFLQRLYGIERYGNKQRKHGGNGYGGNAQDGGILQTLQKLFIFYNFYKILYTEIKRLAAYSRHISVTVEKRHTQCIEYGPNGEHQQQNDSGR